MSGSTVALLVLCIACYTGQTFLNRSFSTAYDGPVNTAASVKRGPTASLKFF